MTCLANKFHLSGSVDLLVISLKLTAAAGILAVAMLLLFIYLRKSSNKRFMCSMNYYSTSLLSYRVKFPVH
jgi:hypothetical protein